MTKTKLYFAVVMLGTVVLAAKLLAVPPPPPQPAPAPSSTNSTSTTTNTFN